MVLHRSIGANRGASRPPSAPPTNGVKRKERDYEQDTSNETNINVVVRCRGRNDREVKENSGVVVSTNGVKGSTVDLSLGPNAISNKTYNFDKVFSPAADQAIIFDDVVAPILSEMLAGYNCTIFAYGQTGTGKTYTMSGDMTETYGLLSDGAGIIPRVLQKLFQKLEADETECSVKCSFIELYNEELRDLLSADDSVKLKIFDDANKKNHGATLVQGMEESHIKNASAGIDLLRKGSHRRQVAATKCNDLSSRSHTVFTITTYIKKSGESSEEYICSGKLNLVDLAGSENIQRSGAENKRAAEAGLINKSLLTLGRVINALVEKNALHIPYRESKLTRLLQDSLGGRTKTCIIATVSPARSNLEETISTLDYAFRAKNIRNKPQINSMINKKTLLKEFTMEIEKLKSELIATRQRNGVYLTNEQFEEMTVESESRRILSEEQKARIETMELSLRNKVQELFSLTNSFTLLKKDNESTKTSLEGTKDVLEKTEIVLKHTSDRLDEETSLREKYALTESRLHQVGSDLISTIGASLRDVDGLHQKLKRRSILHAQNKDAWQEVQLIGSQILTDIDTKLDEVKQEHDTKMEEASQRVRHFVKSELTRSLECRNCVQEGSDMFDEGLQAVEKQSSIARDNMNDVLEEIKDLRDDVKTKVGEGLNGLSDAAARISGEVIAELDQFHMQLHTSYSGLGRDFKNIFEDLTRQLASQREESNRLRRALQEANRKNMEASLAAASQLESSLEAERTAANEEREDLLHQVSLLLTKSASRRDERLNKMIVTSQAKIVEATEDFELADKSYNDGMTRWEEQDTKLQDQVSKSRDDLKSRMQKDWSAIETRNTAIQNSTKAIHEETVKIVDMQVEAMDTQMAALDGFVTRARDQNDAQHEQHLASLSDLSSNVKETFTNLETHFTSDETELFSTTIHSDLEGLVSTVSKLSNTIQGPLSDLASELSQDLIATYMPTGTTPQRRRWEYPTTLPRTIPLPQPQPSTTPTSKPPMRTTSMSPRKFTSPRKSPKKQIIHMDTPHAPLLPFPSTTPSTQPPRPATSSSLKDLDVNTTSVPPTTLVRSASESLLKPVPAHDAVTVTTITSKLPTKTAKSSKTDRENHTLPIALESGHGHKAKKAKVAAGEDKENFTMPITLAGMAEEKAETLKAKMSQSVHGTVGGRTTRSSARRSPNGVEAFARSVSG